MTPGRRILPAALLLGLVAVVAGVAGAGAAALVTSADIKDGTIRVVDLSPATVKKLRGDQGPPGATGATGPRGPQGLRGQYGAPGARGSAYGYAHVYADGTVEQQDGVGISAVSNDGSGQYCLNYERGVARIAVVSIDVATSDSRKDVASVTTEPDAVAASCGATSGADMPVYTADTYVTADVPRAFYVAVIYADDF